MARPKEPPFGTQGRFELDCIRYGRLHRFVLSHIRTSKVVRGSKTRALEAAAAEFSKPYDTVKKQFAHMERSTQAFEAGRVLDSARLQDFLRAHFPPWQADILAREIEQGVLDREEQQESHYWEAVSEDPVAYAFNESERRQLKRVKGAFAHQLANERLELNEFRKQFTQRGKKK